VIKNVFISKINAKLFSIFHNLDIILSEKKIFCGNPITENVSIFLLLGERKG
jgi:hypothetical protein